MEVELLLALSNDFDLTNKSSKLIDLFDEIKKLVISKNYGESILMYVITVICVRHEFDPFFQEGKPFYRENKTYKKKFEFTIKLDYDFYRYSSTEEGEIYVANEIMNRVKNLKYPKKITDFNRKESEKDLESYFKEKGLL